MTLFIITLAAIIIVWAWRRAHPFSPEDGLGPVVGTADRYSQCPVCSLTDTQVPRGRGEVITRGGFYVVRQYHVCTNCNARALWHRRLDKFVWTINRSGVDGIPYFSHG